jgi:hypothetical protein
MKTQDNFDVTVTVRHSFGRERIDGLLVGAFEGGSNYWIRSASPVNEGEDFYEVAPYSGGLCVVDGDGQSNYLTPSALRRGLQTMADKYPRHMADLLAKNDDATTADVFLQCCLFGTLIYG